MTGTDPALYPAPVSGVDPAPVSGVDPAPRGRRRYALVGTGHRAEMYVAALLGPHRDVGVLTALCDTNRTRMEYYRRLCTEADGQGVTPPPAYHSDDYEEMLRRETPDGVIVCTMDSTHARYITAALDRGCDVICEKPLTTDVEGCHRIADAALRADGELVVTFNYRYSPRNSTVKRLLMEGAIGQVTSVDFEWVLDTVHGADYFRRWHRQKANSGGLLVHKATHHFDLVNWWLDDVPETVFALGALRFYGPDGPVGRSRRQGGAPRRGDDPFALDLAASPRLSALYGRAREEDGYVRDGDVFAPGVDIEDNLAVLVGYAGGPSLAYSLNAHAPWEGYRVAFNGTAGRLDLNVCERAAVLPGSAGSAGQVLGRRGVAGEAEHPDGGSGPVLDPSVTPDPVTPDRTGSGGGPRRPGTELILQRHWSVAERIEVPEGGGAHGGGDQRLLDDVFRGAAPDPLGRRAGFQDGIRSVLVGAAANRSIAEGRAVRISELDLPREAYAPSPGSAYASRPTTTPARQEVRG